MVLVKIASDRKDEKNNPYTDLYLCWSYGDKTYHVRVRPVFSCDIKTLMSQALEVDSLSNLSKYVGSLS